MIFDDTSTSTTLTHSRAGAGGCQIDAASICRQLVPRRTSHVRPQQLRGPNYQSTHMNRGLIVRTNSSTSLPDKTIVPRAVTIIKAISPKNISNDAYQIFRNDETAIAVLKYCETQSFFVPNCFVVAEPVDPTELYRITDGRGIHDLR